jgi:hypothetical protein
MMGSKHPSDWISTSPFSYAPEPLLGLRAYFADREITTFNVFDFPQDPLQVEVGHDVWIGAGVLLNRKIKIGTGAIVGARSIVTKDVPPYAIVAGAPAKIVRYRFPEAVVERLLALEWWRYGPEVLCALDVREADGFISRMEDRVANNAPRLDLPPLTASAIRNVYPRR